MCMYSFRSMRSRYKFVTICNKFILCKYFCFQGNIMYLFLLKY